jgi:hypothetical protein
MRTLGDARMRHAEAVTAFGRRAEEVTDKDWMRAPAEGKWSPAHIMVHLTLSFEAFDTDLRGGPPMNMRLTGVKRVIARLVYMQRILRTGRFPAGAPAPREIRPPLELRPRPECLRRFYEAAAQLEKTIAKVSAERPNVRVTHPYFGKVGLTAAVKLSARHIEHHVKQLPGRD